MSRSGSKKNRESTAFLYERLSRDDNLEGDSYSVANQKKLLTKVAKELGYTNLVHFFDDGISGVTMNRPGFKEMIQKIEKCHGSAVFVKDLSRLGRNYIEVGKLTEEFFPEHNIRLVAVSDGIDTNEGENELAPIRNLFNEYYARDTSRKIRSVFQAKGKAGKHVTGTVIYGYLWDEQRKHWLIDEEAAAVVRRIYALTVDGYGPYQIAKKLSADRVEIPSAYLAHHGEGVNKNKVFKDIYDWGSSTIVQILKKREYLGHTVNFKTRKHFKDKKSHYVAENEWLIFENTHEPIIDQNTFDNVQRLRANVRRYPNGWGEAAPLTGLLYCADCGAKMYVHRTNNGKRISQYTCSNYGKIPCGSLCPTQHRINEDVILALVADMLRAIAESLQSDREELVRMIKETQAVCREEDINKRKKRLILAQRRKEELEKLLCKIYEDHILEKIPDARYVMLDEQYAKEQAVLSNEIKETEDIIQQYEKDQKFADQFIALIDKYKNFNVLTNTMLNEFVEKILVHERARKGSQDTTQEVEIYFNFIGRYVPPHFGEVTLTQEEQEEQRKKEERKDKLHQNYLRRKASGSQKAWEEKYNARRKAKMETAKAALRAEDISKGVFIPVNLLPQQAPKNATNEKNNEYK